jgi:serine/threonine protein kinase
MAKLYQLGKYELIKRVAVGGMSEIYLASQGGLSGFERAVILKCIREDLDTDREVLDMFLDEARIAACLKHPHIVHLYDVGEEQGIPFLAMEYIFGRDLMQISERARALGRDLPVQFVVKVMCSALAGLYYAHETAEFEDRPLRVIHRDVSPQNILVSFDGVPKLVDFGIAKAEARLSHTQAGILKGKYAYMSPEQVRGRTLDHRSDQFSLAIVFYEILTSTRLFQRDTDYSTMEAVDTCEIPPIKVLRKDVPRRVVKVLRKATRRNPNRRFKNCKEMERALHKLLKGSAVEQTERMAEFMRTLFASELKARDRAIREADGDEREIILSSGFEMIDERATQISGIPPAPTANRRYEEILAERQGEQTAVGGKNLDASTPENSDSIDTDRGADPRGRAQAQARTAPKGAPLHAIRPSTQQTQEKKEGGLLSDWRLMVLVFVAVMVVAFFVISLMDEPGVVTVKPPNLGPPQAMKTTARPGLDGFLSISVRPSVKVLVDGRSMGNGAFAKYPLQDGVHQILLKEGSQKRSLTVYIKADKESYLAPEAWQ